MLPNRWCHISSTVYRTTPHYASSLLASTCSCGWVLNHAATIATINAHPPAVSLSTFSTCHPPPSAPQSAPPLWVSRVRGRGDGGESQRSRRRGCGAARLRQEMPKEHLSHTTMNPQRLGCSPRDRHQSCQRDWAGVSSSPTRIPVSSDSHLTSHCTHQERVVQALAQQQPAALPLALVHVHAPPLEILRLHLPASHRRNELLKRRQCL
jgi:hypothetical protein